MVTADGKLIEVKNLCITIWGVRVKITATIEILDIRKRLDEPG